jgi:predicted ABC-type ATPase
LTSAADLFIVAGPNGAGKTTFFERVLAPTELDFINADRIASVRWQGAEMAHAYEAAAEAAALRDRYVTDRRSFITESVFSQPSKPVLVQRAVAAGYRGAVRDRGADPCSCRDPGRGRGRRSRHHRRRRCRRR